MFLPFASLSLFLSATYTYSKFQGEVLPIAELAEYRGRVRASNQMENDHTVNKLLPV
jgi:hypothetical protein